VNPTPKILGKNADTAKVSTATASSPAAESASALSVPGAGGTSEFGSTSPNTLTLRRADNPSARRCTACNAIEPIGDPLWPVDVTEGEKAEVCSVRCLLAMLVEEAERPAWLEAWDKVKATRPASDKDPSDPKILRDLADIELAGFIIAADEADRISKLPPPPTPQPKQQPEEKKA
jgi:hypothetical protein